MTAALEIDGLRNPDVVAQLIGQKKPIELEITTRQDSAPVAFELVLAHRALATLLPESSIGSYLPQSPPHTLQKLVEPSILAQLAIAFSNRARGARDRDILDEAKVWLKATKGSIETTSTMLALQRVGPGHASDNSPMFKADIRSVGTALRTAFLRLGLTTGLNDKLVRQIAVFCKEALDNAKTHARESVQDGRPLSGVEFLAMRRLTPKDLDKCVLESDAFCAFRSGVRAIAKARDAESANSLAIVELTIGDAGEGIAATMRETLDVYALPSTFELQCITDALRPGETRPSARPSLATSEQKGFGFVNMLQAIHAVRGMVRVSTGRVVLDRSLISESGAREPFDPERFTVVGWSPHDLPQCRGTAISALALVDLQGRGATDSLFDAQ